MRWNIPSHVLLSASFLIVSCLFLRLSSAVPTPITTIVIEQGINENATEHVNSTVEFIYQFRFDNIVNGSTRDVRVHVTTEDGQSVEYPVLFVVRQQKDVVSWSLPQISKFDPGKMYSRASRTLCSEQPLPNVTDTGFSVKDVEKSVTVTVSTSSPINVTFSIRVTVEFNFIMELGKDYSAHVAPPSPRFYRFIFPPHITQYVLLEVKSNDTICMTVSVQNSTCPVFDEESNVQFSGYWQTMSTQAGMTIRSNDFPNGFYVVFVVHTDDSRCLKDSSSSAYTLEFGDYYDRRKNIDFAVHEKISQIEYVVAITGMIGFFTLFYVLSIVISCVYFCKVKPAEGPIEDTETLDSNPHLDNNDRSIYQPGAAIVGETYNILANEREDTESAQEQMPHHSRTRGELLGHRSAENPMDSSMRSNRSSRSRRLGESDSSLDEVDIDFMDDANRYKDVYRTSRSLYVSALSRKNPRILAKKSQLYLWTLLTVAVFYALPVVQLVLTYQKVLHTTGNQDLCYYNYLCSHPLWLLSDFNHVYSNIGYIMLGILFIILVIRKDRMHQKLDVVSPYFDQRLGIPPHYGLFYTMGAALVMEGILSGCYHVCPNGSNFQFDTAFMYVIAMMCILRIYQARHPDINSSAFMAFASLAFVILVGVIGIMAASLVFWVVFTTLHVGFCLFLTIQIYYLGRWKLDCGLFSRIYLSWRNDCLAGPLTCLRPLYIDRFILLTIANMVNWSVAALGIVNFTQPSALGLNVDFATHLLFIFMSNLFLYTTFYILMKLAHREKILPQPATYILLSVVFWSLAGFVFLHKSTSWQMSPAGSRTFNRECLLLRFYDTHDLWHVLSASAMFFSFMMYLTLDDDLISTPRTRIPVF